MKKGIIIGAGAVCIAMAAAAVVLIVNNTNSKMNNPKSSGSAVEEEISSEAESAILPEASGKTEDIVEMAENTDEKKDADGSSKDETDGRAGNGDSEKENSENGKDSVIGFETEKTVSEKESAKTDITASLPENKAEEEESGQNTDSYPLNASTAGENDTVTYGIDVSKYQGDIDWAQVAATGIDFAIIRAGYRDPGSANLGADSYALKNIQEATENGVKVGVYFFSTAVSVEEAQAEADWLADLLAPYSITYPVAYDCEGFEHNRQAGLTKEERTNVAMAFMNRIYQRGYTPMFYSAVENIENDAKWDTSRLEIKYKMWVARYNQETSDYALGPDYAGQCAMWQYSCHSRIAGVYNAEVDLDVAFFGYDGVEPPKNAGEERDF